MPCRPPSFAPPPPNNNNNNMKTCPIRDIFGRPGEGVHRARILGLAVMDVLLTVLAAVLLHVYVFRHMSIALVLVCTFAVGVVVHRMLDVRTAVDMWLFPSSSSHRASPSRRMFMPEQSKYRKKQDGRIDDR